MHLGTKVQKLEKRQPNIFQISIHSDLLYHEVVIYNKTSQFDRHWHFWVLK